MLLLQLTWVFAVPPFRGSDEFDHVYRAASVARGDWAPDPSDATRGTGAWMMVPADIVHAARAQCQDLPYTVDVDCVGIEKDDDQVRIASGAGRYHPLFYAVVGVPSLPFSGYAVLYAMRLATVLCTWLLFCCVLAATRTWNRTAWPTTGVVIACTPVLVYSASVVAPNGVEMMAGLTLWSALIGLLRAPPRHHTLLLVLTAISGSLLVTTRSLGPMWCLMILATVILAARPSGERLRLLLRRRGSWATAAVILAATAGSVAWILQMGALDVGGAAEKPFPFDVRLEETAHAVPLWALQSIAAFPLRNEQSLTAVYICYLLLFLAILGLGMVVARGRTRWGIVTAVLASMLVPFAITLATFNQHANVWQGRYALPYSVGMVLLCALALDDADKPIGPRFRVGAVVLFALPHALAPANVLHKSIGRKLSDYSHFVHPAPWVLVLSATISVAMLWWHATAREPEAVQL